MKYNEKFIVRGLPKDKDWVGWTDGLSIITGVKIPFTVLPFNQYYPISANDVIFELKRNFIKYGNEPLVTLIKTPAAAGIINSEGLILNYTRIDYYEIMFDFGLSKTHSITYDVNNERVHIYDAKKRFAGFFGVYSHLVWKDLLGVNIPYENVIDEFRKEENFQ